MQETPQQARVRPITLQDESAWRRLWAGYCQFYEVDMSDEQTDFTWDRISKGTSTIHGLVAENSEGRVVGICNYLLHDSCWTMASVCYLQDLFVEPGLRGVGVGEALVSELSDLMKSSGWSRIYWMTKENNYRARGLYDKFTRADGFVRYVIKRPV